MAHIQNSHSGPDPQPRKSPRQARSRATVAAIQEAAARILRDGGLDRLTTNRIAEVAGVSVGSLYQYYPSREAILAALVRDFRLGMSERLAAASMAARDWPLSRAIPHLMATAVERYETDPALVTALEAAEAQLPRDPDVLAARRHLRAALIDCLDRHGIADPAIAAQDIFAMTRGIVMADLAAARGRPVDFDGLRRRIARAALGYLGEGVAVSAPPHTPPAP